MKLPKVLGTNVLCKIIPPKEKVVNGIIIPLSEENLYEPTLEVCAIGKDCQEVCVGDLIYVNYLSRTFMYNNENYQLIEESTIKAILPKDE